MTSRKFTVKLTDPLCHTWSQISDPPPTEITSEAYTPLKGSEYCLQKQ